MREAHSRKKRTEPFAILPKKRSSYPKVKLKNFNELYDFPLDGHHKAHLIPREIIFPDIVRLAIGKEKLSKYFTTEKIRVIDIAYKREHEELAYLFRKWESKRRSLLKILNENIKNLENVRQYSAEGRLVSSVIDIFGRIVAVAIKPFNSTWSSGILYTSSAFCFMTLVITLVEMSKSKVITEAVMDAMREDRDSSKRIRLWFRRSSEFERQVQNFFPHGIDLDIAECLLDIRKCKCDLRTLAEQHLPEGESLQPGQLIRLIILLSNAGQDEDLLHDDDFLAKVDIFSKSSIAHKWFNKFKYQRLFSMSDPDARTNRIQDCMWKDSSRFHNWPSLCGPLCMLSSQSIACNLILDSLTAVEAYSDLQIGSRTKESKILREIRNQMKQELDGMEEIYYNLRSSDFQLYD